MEDHKTTKKDKVIYGLTLGVIFFGVLILGLAGVIVNVLGG